MGHIYGLGECHIRIDYTSILYIKFIQQQISKNISLFCKKNVKDTICLAAETAVFFEVTRCKNLKCNITLIHQQNIVKATEGEKSRTNYTAIVKHSLFHDSLNTEIQHHKRKIGNWIDFFFSLFKYTLCQLPK